MAFFFPSSPKGLGRFSDAHCTDGIALGIRDIFALENIFFVVGNKKKYFG